MTSTAAPAASSTPGARPRLESVDIVRGLIMIIMALDHVRQFFGFPGAEPTNMATATPMLFLTRLVTHVCAPTFFLLTGTGAYLSLRRKSVPELSRFLITRGLWLIFLELVVIRCLSYQFNFDYKVTMLIVIWALGWGMITLGLLIRLPIAAIAALGAVMVAGHNLLDPLPIAHPFFSILHRPGFVINTPEHVLFVAYPLIPWIGVTWLGFALGRVFDWAPERRRTFLLRGGLALAAAFLVVRGINAYGDPRPWAEQSTTAMSIASFFNASKTPPSLVFLLMTLGPALLLLRAVDAGAPAWLRPAIVFGKVPMFYYFAHFTLIHLLAAAVAQVRYGSAHWFFESPDLANYPFVPPPEWGYSLPIIYGLWILVVVALYVPCRWFADLKQRRQDAWLSYL